MLVFFFNYLYAFISFYLYNLFRVLALSIGIFYELPHMDFYILDSKLTNYDIPCIERYSGPDIFDN